VREETTSACSSAEHSAQQLLTWLVLTTVIEITVWRSAMSSSLVKTQDALKAQVSYKRASVCFTISRQKPSLGCRRLFQTEWQGNTAILWGQLLT